VVDLTNDFVVASKQQQLQMQFFFCVFLLQLIPVNLLFVQKQTHVEK
jgi:hypothetical protein